MTKHVFFLVSTLGFGALTMGCSNADELVKASEAYATAACECKDAACATKASQDYATATQALAGKNLKPSEDEAKKITDATTKATGCVTKAAMAGIPGATP